MGYKKKIKKIPQEQLDEYKKMKYSVLYFIKLMWRLKPQPVKAEYVITVNRLIKERNYKDFKVEYFSEFKRGKHVTWQQYALLLGVDDAINGRSSKRISVRSGHGVGKSTSMSWILLWYIFTRPGCKIGATAPSENQLFDVLWNEISLWIKRMPETVQEKYEWQSKYIRMLNNQGKIEDSWFARAKTARKENPEALAGIHSPDGVLLLADEASGIPEELFSTMEGSLTEDNILVILISNPTRLVGYFYNSQMDEKFSQYWQRFHFSCIDSPIPNEEYVHKIKDMHGEHSDEYCIRVLGDFPKEDSVDKEGYAPMWSRAKIDMAIVPEQDPNTDPKEQFTTAPLMGIDPAGEGQDETSWIIRDAFKAKIVLKEAVSDENTIAQRTITLMHVYGVPEENVYVDMFGVGAKTCLKLAKLGYDINGVNVGDQPEDDDDKEMFLNIRARNYYGRFKKWISNGGEIVEHDKVWVKEMMAIRYRRSTEQNSKIQIMSKRKMLKDGYRSPNHVDAIMITFSHDEDMMAFGHVHQSQTNEEDDPYAHYNNNNIDNQSNLHSNI